MLRKRKSAILRKLTFFALILSQIVQVLGLGIAGSCGLFLLGNYGVQGDFSNDGEEWHFGAIMIFGGASLLVTAVCLRQARF